MYCLQCNYDMRGLPENRCPECGAAFDPTDPTSFKLTPDRERAWPGWLAVAALGHPFTTVLLIHATWFAARLGLGRWPVLFRDDPTSVNPFVTGLYDVSGFALIGFGVVALAYPVLLLTSIFAWLRRRVRAGVPLLIAASALGWIAAFVYIRLDPWRIIDWFMD